MGLAPLWHLRGAEHAAEPELVTPVADPRPAPPVPIAQAVSRVAQTVLEAVSAPAATPAPRDAAAKGSGLAHMGWEELDQAVKDCRACGLCKARKQTVFGVGDREADWLFVGEGPGAEEDERGEPFVGQAGKLLDAMLGSIGLQRGQDVYIANSVKCRPPGNRTPEAGEIAACHPYLERQIELIKPRLIVALGRPAAQTLLNAEIKISSARGRVFDRHGIPVVVTYHPAYLLRNLEDKHKAWEDLCFAVDQMQALKKN
nr:uracil-DNA glycosylase [Uliginosibacterium gangwonense]